MAAASSALTRSHPLPLPAKEREKKPKKDGLDHVAKYTSSVDGAWDFFTGVNQVTGAALRFPNLKESLRAPLKAVNLATDLFGTALAWPSLFSDINDLRHSAAALCKAKAIPIESPRRRERVQRAYQKTILRGAGVVKTSSQASRFLQDAKLVHLGPAFPIVSGIYYASALIKDGGDLLAQLGIIKKAQSRSEDPSHKRKITVAFLKVVKDVAIVAAAVIGLISLVFGVLPKLALVLLACATLELVFNVSAYFYNEIGKQKRSSRH